MKMFFFHFKAEPVAENSSAADLAGADVFLWIRGGTVDEARMGAEAHVAQYGWKVLECTLTRQADPDLVQRLHPDEFINYQKAIQFGVSAMFSAWPKVDRPVSDGVEIRHMPPQIPLGKPGQDC